MAFDEIYTDGTDAVRKLWQVGDEYSFTVVATADETATNSFSLFGGDAPADLTVVTDLTDAPTDQANTNDDVLLGENPFPDDHTCPEEGTTSTPTPSCDGYACAEGNIAKAEPNSIFCAGECTADDCCNPTCGDVDDDGDGGSEADDLFACPTGQELKANPLTVECATGECSAADCCQTTSAPAPTDNSGARRTAAGALAVATAVASALSW